MGRRGTSVPPVRGRLVRAAALAAVAVAVASLAHGELESSSRGSRADAADPGIVLAPKVASSATPTAILIRVTAPMGQLPGVVYTVTRVTRRGPATVCAGRAPLRCTDPVGTPGTSVSYTVSSTLDGRRTATTSVDTATTPRPVPTTAARHAIRETDDAGSQSITVSAHRSEATTSALDSGSATGPKPSTGPASSTALAAGTSTSAAPTTGSPTGPSGTATTTGHGLSPSGTHTTATTSAGDPPPDQTTATDTGTH